MPVLPQTEYRASVWVQGVDLHGNGFGAEPGDSAGLCIQELGQDGKLLVDHGKAAITDAGDFREVVQTFTTGDQTTQVRFILDTVIGAPYHQAHVTYDDCELRAVEGQE